jgi:hypothetical protein
MSTVTDKYKDPLTKYKDRFTTNANEFDALVTEMFADIEVLKQEYAKEVLNELIATFESFNHEHAGAFIEVLELRLEELDK